VDINGVLADDVGLTNNIEGIALTKNIVLFPLIKDRNIMGIIKIVEYFHFYFHYLFEKIINIINTFNIINIVELKAIISWNDEDDQYNTYHNKQFGNMVKHHFNNLLNNEKNTCFHKKLNNKNNKVDEYHGVENVIQNNDNKKWNIYVT